MKLSEVLIDQVKRQGFSVIILCVAIWFFYERDKGHEKKIEDCQNEIVQVYRVDHSEMRELLAKCIEVIEESNECKRSRNE